MHFRNAYFRSLVHSSQKLWSKPDEGNFAPCILPCKIGGSQNLMKGRYLSKTPFLTFVYISKCNINLPGYFRNSKKKGFCELVYWSSNACYQYFHLQFARMQLPQSGPSKPKNRG